MFGSATWNRTSGFDSLQLCGQRGTQAKENRKLTIKDLSPVRDQGPGRVGLVRRFRAKDGSPHVYQKRVDMGHPVRAAS